MCKDKVLMWLSGAAALDAIVHFSLAVFGRAWYNVSTTMNLVLFVVFALVAVVLGYMAVNLGHGSNLELKKKR